MKQETTITQEREIREHLAKQYELIESREDVREKIEEVKRQKRDLEMEEREWTTKIMGLSAGRISDMTGVSVHVVTRVKRQFDVEQRVKKELEAENESN